MFNKVLKFTFAIVGAITGLTLVNALFSVYNFNITQSIKLIAFCAVSMALALVLYSTADKITGFLMGTLDNIEKNLQNMTLYELLISSIGLIFGLIVANLSMIPISKVDIIGVPISIIVNILFGTTGVYIALRKRNEALFNPFTFNKKEKKNDAKILDTSAIIDGRIVDICRTGFLEGVLIIPNYVLDELRKISDSADALKRNRGRRGFEIINILQKELKFPVKVENFDYPEIGDVDEKLLKSAKQLNGTIITVDYNLNRSASVQDVHVLNINDLANAVKPIALPGEEMTIQIVKDGKENGQGIGYLDDGTMIVVEGGKNHIGETLAVAVTSVLQTSAGRMIFAKPKYKIERVI